MILAASMTSIHVTYRCSPLQQVLIWLGGKLTSNKLVLEAIEEVLLSCEVRIWKYHAQKLAVEPSGLA